VSPPPVQGLGLQCGAQCHDLVGIDVGERRLADHLGDLRAHQRHTRRAAHQHHALDVRRFHTGIGQHAAGDLERARQVGVHHGVELGARQRMEGWDPGDLETPRGLVAVGKLFLHVP